MSNVNRPAVPYQCNKIHPDDIVLEGAGFFQFTHHPTGHDVGDNNRHEILLTSVVKSNGSCYFPLELQMYPMHQGSCGCGCFGSCLCSFSYWQKICEDSLFLLCCLSTGNYNEMLHRCGIVLIALQLIGQRCNIIEIVSPGESEQFKAYKSYYSGFLFKIKILSS